MIWVLFIFLQVQGAWFPLPLNVSTRTECEELGSEIINISQETTKNAQHFVCAEIPSDDAEKFISGNDEND